MPTFTPVSVTDPAKEKDWAYEIGRLDWDNTKIVFTKRSLLEFLRYTGTSVDTNMSNISKLPRYCQFGKITEGEPAPAQAEHSASAASATQDAKPAAPASSEEFFKPTRRVREAPGGTQHLNLFDGEFADDALSNAPKASVSANQDTPAAAPTSTGVAEDTTTSTTQTADIPKSGIEGFVPTRRVREAPGGKDSLGSIWGD